MIFLSFRTDRFLLLLELYISLLPFSLCLHYDLIPGGLFFLLSLPVPAIFSESLAISIRFETNLGSLICFACPVQVDVPAEKLAAVALLHGLRGGLTGAEANEGVVLVVAVLDRGHGRAVEGLEEGLEVADLHALVEVRHVERRLDFF